MKLIATISAFLGAIIAQSASMGCITIILDEVEMPESLIK